MNTDRIEIDQADLRKLLTAANGDAALLYLYLRCGNDPANCEDTLRLSGSRLSCAAAILRQLGLWPEPRKTVVLSGERPQYSEQDVLRAGSDFQLLQGEVQRLLGRILNTEELKILLSFERYLGLPAEVISVLICYCKDRARQRGSLRNPSLRAIEKEAYAWAEQGIDSVEEAAAYIQRQNARNSRMGKLLQLLQIRGRTLTAAEERYAQSWLDMGFEDEAISMAYERTCINTGALKWPYMNSILTRWHEAGLHTADQIRGGDRKSAVPKGASGELGEAELAAIARTLREG